VKPLKVVGEKSEKAIMPCRRNIFAISMWSAILMSCSQSNFTGQTQQNAPKPKKDSDQVADERIDIDADKGKNKLDGEDDDVDFDSDSDSDQGSVSGPETDSDIDFREDDPEIQLEDGPMRVKKCSRDYSVPGRSNPWLAGMPQGTSISYKKGDDDRVPSQEPLLVDPDIGDCIKEGAKLYFLVSGTIDHGGGASNADGRLESVVSHERGSIHGKAGTVAPINALMAVFLEDGTPTVAPSSLDFSSQASRDYAELKPAVGQVFYIGDGKTGSGVSQKVVVPRGAKRLFFGIMDSYEWNNNSGSLTGSILWDPR